MVRLVATPLTPDGWAPFGWIPVSDADATDGEHTLTFEWADPHLNVISHAYGEVEHTADGAVCARLYRHTTHTQALMPINRDAVLAVAPPDTDFTSPGSIDLVRAFHVDPLEALVLHQGTWHWGPFPLGPDPVRLLNIQGRRYAEDNEHVDLDVAAGAAVEVVAR